MFLSSHILPEVQHNCTHAAVIRDGTLIAEGSVEALISAGAKRVTVRGRADFAALDGVRDLRLSPEGAAFLYSGDMRALLAVLAAGDVRDLAVSEPDLEEVFLHYYDEGGDRI